MPFRVFRILALFWTWPLFAQEPELWEELPRRDQAVHDFAEVIAADLERQLEMRLRNAYQTTATPLVVVTVPSLAGGQIDDFTNRLYERWGIGTQPDNRGALFLVAVEDREMRIEVGYGTEPVLTDSYTSQLVRDRAAPRFRQGDYGGGIAAVVEGLIEPLETGETPPTRPGGQSGADVPEWLLFLIFIFLSLIFGRFGGGRRRRRGRYRRGMGGPFIGGGFGGGGFGGGGFSGGGGGGFGGFGGGFSGGGGASGGW